jgi:hypothetical protein
MVSPFSIGFSTIERTIMAWPAPLGWSGAGLVHGRPEVTRAKWSGSDFIFLAEFLMKEVRGETEAFLGRADYSDAPAGGAAALGVHPFGN